MIGTDDEFALRKAVRPSHAFPNSTQTNQAEKKMTCRIVGNLFSHVGLANAESQAEFQERSQEIVHYSEQNLPWFTAHLRNKLIPFKICINR